MEDKKMQLEKIEIAFNNAVMRFRDELNKKEPNTIALNLMDRDMKLMKAQIEKLEQELRLKKG